MSQCEATAEMWSCAWQPGERGRGCGGRRSGCSGLGWSSRWGLAWGWRLATSPTSWAWPHFQRVLAPYGACFICSAATWEGGQCSIVWQRRWDTGTGTCPCPVGWPPEPGALRLARVAAQWPHPRCSRGASRESRRRRLTHPRGSGAEPAPRVRERPGAERDRPATGRCLVGGKRGSAVPDSSEHRRQFCDSDAGLAQHQKVTARSTHPGLRGAGAFSA